MDDRKAIALMTDLYQLTMAQSYFQSGKFAPATFSLFIRTYPAHRGFFVAAGLQDVLRFLAEFAFDSAALDYLHAQQLFDDDFLDFLQRLRFTGDVRALPEGSLVFKDEPILEVTAPIIEAQIVETFIINQINLQMLIATKAARCVHSAAGRPLVDFSLRRTHGIDAGLKVARSSYLAGFSGTSNVLAGKLYELPIVGTMAHSFVSSFEREIDAFRSFVDSFPENSILLIDTYDTVEGARKAVQVAREMAARGQRLRGVRIDSGDLATLAHSVRRIFDEAGFHEVKIIGSGGLDEYDLDALAKAGAPYNSYGVGTKMGVSGDAPWFDIAYKLVEYDNRPVLKLSTGKASCPGKKQVFRFADSRGHFARDVIGLHGEELAEAEPLLKKVMGQGRIAQRLPSLKEIRENFRSEFGRLDESIKAIRNPAIYPVEVSFQLRQLQDTVERRIAQAH